MKEGLTDLTVIKSSIYGEIVVEKEQIFNFSQGIVGFEMVKNFALIPVNDTALISLHAFDEELGLLLFPAELCENHIQFELDEETVEQLQAKEANELSIYYIVRMIDNRPYINQKAPIIVSQRSKRGCQFVIPNEALSVREPLVIKGE